MYPRFRDSDEDSSPSEPEEAGLALLQQHSGWVGSWTRSTTNEDCEELKDGFPHSQPFFGRADGDCSRYVVQTAVNCRNYQKAGACSFSLFNMHSTDRPEALLVELQEKGFSARKNMGCLDIDLAKLYEALDNVYLLQVDFKNVLDQALYTYELCTSVKQPVCRHLEGRREFVAKHPKGVAAALGRDWCGWDESTAVKFAQAAFAEISSTLARTPKWF